MERKLQSVMLTAALTLLLAGCMPSIKPAIHDTPQHKPMTPQQEAAAWCTLGFYGPGMSGFCDEKRGKQ